MSAAPKTDAARAEYDAIDAVNWSTLVHLHTSAKLLRWRAEHPREDSSALRLGTLIHCAILEPERLASTYIAEPDFGNLSTNTAKAKRAAWLAALAPGDFIPRPYIDAKTKAGKAARERFYAELPEGARVLIGNEDPAALGIDVELLTAEEHATVTRCVRAVHEHPVAAEMLRGGRAEETIVWTDEATGLRCKARLDFLRPDGITDLKSTRGQTLDEIERALGRYLYHGQLAFYQRGAVAVRAVPPDSLPRVIAVQNCEPFDVVPAELHPEALAKGDGLCRTLLRKYAEHRIADYWPGLAPGLVRLNVPTWAPAGDAEMDLDDGDEW